VQARAVRKLRAAGALRIVVPAPLLEAATPSRLPVTRRRAANNGEARTGDPLVDEAAAIARSRRDLPRCSPPCVRPATQFC
jgi:hypothetical protein